jgi:dihydrofolate synthase/folylpolyglutamate synthase
MALDHTAVLGPAIEDIARDKACAIRSSAPVFSSPQPPEAAAVIAERAKAFQAPLVLAEPLPADIQLGLAGAHQRVNAATALACARTMLDMLGVPASEASLAQGLACAFIPGRLQSVPRTAEHPAFLLDGAHNPHGMASLASFLAQGDVRPRAAVYSCLRDKDWRTALGMLAAALPDVPYLVPAMHNERAEAPGAILHFLQEHGVREAAACPSLTEALAQAELAPGAGPVLVTGSLYLLADFFALHPGALERPAR